MLYKRGNIWWVKFKAAGQVIQRSARTASKREAAEYERALRNEVAENLHAGRTGKPVKRLYREALLKWINEGAPKSMWTHARNTRPHLDDVPLHLVVPAAHEMKSAMLRDGLSPLTINRRLAVVRRVLNLAYKEWEWIREPLGDKIQMFSEKGMAREFYLSHEEVQQLADAIDNPEARKVVLIAAYTGLRRGEILKLEARHWQPPYIILDSKTKGKRGRAVPVIEDIQDLMTPPFKINPHTFAKIFERARESIGRPDIRFHDLRHTYASWLASNPDVPLSAIRDILGHSSLTVTSKYAHLRGDTFDTVAKALTGKKEG